MALIEEREFFDQNLADWLVRHPDRFVLVKRHELIGTFATLDEALTEGARRFGLESFLVRQVLPAQPEISAPALTLGLLHADTSLPGSSSGSADRR